MRIGYDCLLLQQHRFGVGNCIAQQAEALVRTGAGHDLILYGHDPFPHVNLSNTAGAARVSLVRVTTLTQWRIGRILWEQLVLRGRAHRDALDLLHCPAYVMPVAASVPVVLNVYDLLALSRPELCAPMNRRHFELMLPWSIRRARRVVVPSRAVRDQVRERFAVADGRVELIPPGIDACFAVEPAAADLARVKQRYELAEPFVLFVGMWEPKKNLARLIDAYRIAGERRELAGELVLAGGDGWGDVFTGRRSVPGVRQLGFVPLEDLRALYGLARVLAFPSLAEGFGLPVLEAMASGLPVVCSDVPALLDADPNAAIRVDPLSVDSIATGLARAWGDEPVRTELISRGRTAAARFSWDESARRIWRVYAEVVDDV